MRIDCIMAVYRPDERVFAAASSVLKQLSPLDCLIICNDGSGIAYDQIFEELKKLDTRVKLVSNATNKGLPFTLNKMIMLSDADYLARVDADDLWLPEKLNKQKSYIKKTNAKVVGTGAFIVCGKRSNKVLFNDSISTVNSGRKFLTNNYLFHSSVLLESNLLKEHLYDENLRRSQDKDLWIRIIQSGTTIHNIDLPLIEYSYCGSKTIKSIWFRFKSDIIISLKHKRYFQILWALIYLIRGCLKYFF